MLKSPRSDRVISNEKDFVDDQQDSLTLELPTYSPIYLFTYLPTYLFTSTIRYTDNPAQKRAIECRFQNHSRPVK
jgi:hypothetical protein